MTLIGHDRPRKLWSLWVGLVSLGLLAGLLAGLVVAAVRSVSAVDPVQDEAGQAVVLQRLSAAQGDLDAVPEPVDSRATSAAKVSGCDMDSGEVFEPTIHREWRLLGTARSAHYDEVTAGGRRVGSAIASALIARGWSGSPRLTGRDFPATDLTKRYGGHEVGLSIQVFDDSVLVGGHTKHPRVCRRHV